MSSSAWVRDAWCAAQYLHPRGTSCPKLSELGVCVQLRRQRRAAFDREQRHAEPSRRCELGDRMWCGAHPVQLLYRKKG